MHTKYIGYCLSLLLSVIGYTAFAQASSSPPAGGTTASMPAPTAKPIAATTPSATTTSTTLVRPRPKPVVAPTAQPATTSTIPGPVWKKQITRDVEMGEKVDSNVHHLRDASSNNTLLEMFAIGIKSGKISSFYTPEFSMATRINVKDFNKLFVGKADTIVMRDAAGRYVSKATHKGFNYAGIHKYRIQEEWTSYPAVGKTEIQIVGIAPLKDIIGDDKVNHGVEPIFWVHYTEDIKAILARYDQYHPNNTLGGRLWDEYFTAQK